VEEAFALHNSSLLQAFEAYRILVSTKYVTAPSLFKRDDWRQMEMAEVRAEMLAKHAEHLAKYEWNDTEPMKVSVMLQGTTPEAARSIAQGGFGVARKEDQGFYGKGIYTTSSMKYACRYAEIRAAVSKKPSLLLSAIIPGNPFPITQRQDGRSVEDGYQSHFTIGTETLVTFKIRYLLTIS